MKIKMKKKVLPLLMVGLIVLSGSALASRPASYDVKDEEARNTLSKIEGQLEEVRKYLEAIDSKESSLDAMDKNDTMRTNDSMRKLSADTSSGNSATASFMKNLNTSILGKNIPGLGQLKNLQGLFGKGKGGFLQLLTGSLMQDLNDFDTFIDSKESCSQSVDQYMQQFDGIITGQNYKGLKTPQAINTVYMQNMKLLAENNEKLGVEKQQIKEMKKKMDDKDSEKLEALSEAKDTRTDDKDKVMQSITQFGSILGGVKQMNNPIAILKDPGKVFNTDATESITAAQERTTGTVVVQASQEARESKTKDACEKIELKEQAIQDAQEMNKANRTIALSEAEKEELKEIKVSKLKLKSAFADEYGHLVQ